MHQSGPPTSRTSSVGIQPAPAFAARAKELLGIIAGTGDYASFFTTGSQTAVPKDKYAPVNVQLNAAYGAPVELDAMTLQSPYAGNVHIRY